MNEKTNVELAIEANTFSTTFILSSLGLTFVFGLAGTNGAVALPLAFASAAVFASRAASKSVENWRAEKSALVLALSEKLQERA